MSRNQLFHKQSPDERIRDSLTVNNMFCLVTDYGISSNSYSYIRINGKRHAIHRYMYEKHIGKIPEGYVIDHLCENIKCVNPYHLEAVTCRENVLRGTGITSRQALDINVDQEGK